MGAVVSTLHETACILSLRGHLPQSSWLCLFSQSLQIQFPRDDSAAEYHAQYTRTQCRVSTLRYHFFSLMTCSHRHCPFAQTSPLFLAASTCATSHMSAQPFRLFPQRNPSISFPSAHQPQ